MQVPLGNEASNLHPVAGMLAYGHELTEAAERRGKIRQKPQIVPSQPINVRSGVVTHVGEWNAPSANAAISGERGPRAIIKEVDVVMTDSR